MTALADRAGSMLLHPVTEWQVIKDESVVYRDIPFCNVAILAVLPPAAAIAGRYFFDLKLSDVVIQSSFRYITFTNRLWYFMYVLNGVVLLYQGISSLASVGRTRAEGYTIASFLSAAIIVGVMSLFEYMLETTMASMRNLYN